MVVVDFAFAGSRFGIGIKGSQQKQRPFWVPPILTRTHTDSTP